MKRIFYIIILAYIISFSGCQLDSVNAPIYTGEFEVKGVIEQWNQPYTNIKLLTYTPYYPFRYVIAAGKIETDGFFTIKTYAPPVELTNLLTLPEYGGNCNTQLTTSTDSIRYLETYVEVYDNAGNAKGVVVKRNFTEVIVNGSFFSYYCWFNKKGIANGKQVCYNGPDSTVYSIAVDQNGQWALLSGIYELVGPGSQSFLTTTNEPTGALWYYEPYDAPNKFFKKQFLLKDITLF